MGSAQHAVCKSIWCLSEIAWTQGSQHLERHKIYSLSAFLFLVYLIKVAVLLSHLLGPSQSLFEIQEEPCTVPLSYHSPTLFCSQICGIDYIFSEKAINSTTNVISSIFSQPNCLVWEAQLCSAVGLLDPAGSGHVWQDWGNTEEYVTCRCVFHYSKTNKTKHKHEKQQQQQNETLQTAVFSFYLLFLLLFCPLL